MGFMKWVLAPDKNSYGFTGQGDKGFTQLMHEGKAFVPGSYADLHGIAAAMLNQPIVALMKDSECSDGIYYQIGNTCFPGRLSAEFMTGTTKDGAKGYAFSPTSTFKRPLLYQGVVTLIKPQQAKLLLAYIGDYEVPVSANFYSNDPEQLYFTPNATGAVSLYDVNDDGVGVNDLPNIDGANTMRLYTTPGGTLYSLQIEDAGITSVTGALPTGLVTLDLTDNNIATFTAPLPAGLKNILLDGNALNVAAVSALLVEANALGLSNGNIVLTQATPAIPNSAGQAAITALEGRGYTVTVDE